MPEVAPPETSSNSEAPMHFSCLLLLIQMLPSSLWKTVSLVWEEWAWSIPQCLTILKQAKRVLYISTCLHAPEVSRTVFVWICSWALTVNQWWSWLQAFICSGNSASFCDWLCRKCKSSSWPAFPFPLLCWEEPLWLLIVQFWLSFTLKDKIFADGLWNRCSFKKYSWSLWPELKGHTDPLIYLNKCIYISYI